MPLPSSTVNPRFVGAPKPSRRRRQRRRSPIGRVFARMQVNRRDLWIIAAVLLTAAILLRFTTVFDHWFDRFSSARPDQQQQLGEFAGQPGRE